MGKAQSIRRRLRTSPPTLTLTMTAAAALACSTDSFTLPSSVRHVHKSSPIGTVLVCQLNSSSECLVPRKPRIRTRQGFGLHAALTENAGESDISSTDHTRERRSDETGSTSSVGLYVHIPYCRRRCRYCDFAIVPIGPSVLTDDVVDDGGEGSVIEGKQNDGFRRMDATYREAVLAELDLVRRTTLGKVPLRSIYFGGGTPSLAPVSTLRAILESLLSSDGPFYVPNHDEASANPIEITIEMDPGSFTRGKLQSLKEAGFNRISLGVQSFDDAILQSIGRVHRRSDIFSSIDMIQQVFGDEGTNYSIDLISGLPGLTLAGWAETLQTAVELRPQPSHLSLYDLQVEQGTVFGRWYDQKSDDYDTDNEDEAGVDHSSWGSEATARTRSAPGVGNTPLLTGIPPPPLPTPDDCAFMYRFASGYLKAKGYEHYEISSYAKLGGGRSRHNQIYWEIGSEWYALGLGATSSVGGLRFARPRTMADYIEWVEKQRSQEDASNQSRPSWLPAHGGAGEGAENLDDDSDYLTDIIMTRLRTVEGLDLNLVRQAHGPDKVEAVLRGAELALDMGLAQRIVDDEKDHLRLVDPNGFLFSNSIISQIFVELDELAS